MPDQREHYWPMPYPPPPWIEDYQRENAELLTQIVGLLGKIEENTNDDRPSALGQGYFLGDAGSGAAGTKAEEAGISTPGPDGSHDEETDAAPDLVDGADSRPLDGDGRAVRNAAEYVREEWGPGLWSLRNIISQLIDEAFTARSLHNQIIKPPELSARLVILTMLKRLELDMKSADR